MVGGGSVIPESFMAAISERLSASSSSWPIWTPFAQAHIPYGTPMRRPEELSPVESPTYQHGMALGDGTVLILDGSGIISTTSGWEMEPVGNGETFTSTSTVDME